MASGTEPNSNRFVRSYEAAALAGAVSAVLLLVVVILLERQPDPDTSVAEIASWYSQRNNRWSVMLALNLAPFSGIALLWFVAVLRRRLGAREDQFFSTVFQGSGTIFAATVAIASASSALPVLIVSTTDNLPTREVLDVSSALWVGLFGGVGSRFGAVFMLTTSTLGLRFQAFPRWLSVSGYATAGVLLFTGALAGPYGILFPIWLLVLSGWLFLERGHLQDSGHP